MCNQPATFLPAACLSEQSVAVAHLQFLQGMPHIAGWPNQLSKPIRPRVEAKCPASALRLFSRHFQGKAQVPGPCQMSSKCRGGAHQFKQEAARPMHTEHVTKLNQHAALPQATVQKPRSMLCLRNTPKRQPACYTAAAGRADFASAATGEVAGFRVTVSGAVACAMAALISGRRFWGGATTYFGSSYLKPAQ